MPRLDQAIERLFLDNGTQLVLETGGGITLQTPNGPQALVSRRLSTPQVLQVVQEIAPPQATADLEAMGATSFTYASPNGKVDVQVEHVDGMARAVVRRPKE